MKKTISKVIKFVLPVLSINFFLAHQVSAALLNSDTKTKIGANAWSAGFLGGYDTSQSDQLLVLVQIVINAFLSIIGVILMIYILYSGYNWLTSHGEEEKVEKAKDTLKRAIIGVIIIAAAYAISTFVIFRLQAGILSNGGSQAPAASNSNSYQDSLQEIPGDNR